MSITTTLPQLLDDYPFVNQFLGDEPNKVDFTATKIVSAEVLNSVATLPLEDDADDHGERNVYFLSQSGDIIFQVVSEDQEVSLPINGPRSKSIGRQFLSQTPGIQQNTEYILVQEWEYGRVSVTLYRAPSRYSLWEFVEELKKEVKWLHLD